MKESAQAKVSCLTKNLLCPLLLLLIASHACVKLPRRASAVDDKSAAQTKTAESGNAPRININTASTAELESLPGIGRALAARIIEHRQNFGRFRRAEHLMIVRGISARRFQAVRALVIAE